MSVNTRREGGRKTKPDFSNWYPRNKKGGNRHRPKHRMFPSCGFLNISKYFFAVRVTEH